jgi:integrase
MYLARPGRAGLRKSTGVRIDAATPGQRRDQKLLAQQICDTEQATLAATQYQELATRKPVITFAEYAEWYTAHVIPTHARRGQAKDRSRLRVLVAYFTDTPLHLIDAAGTQEFITWRRQQGLSNNSINRELDDLKVLLTRAVPMYLAASPLVGFRRLRPQEFEARVLTREEFDRLLAACATTEEVALLETAVNTLLRLSSLVTLKPEHDKRTYFVTLNAKVRQAGAPIPPVLREALDAMPPPTGPYLFFNHIGRRGGGETARENAIIRWFAKLCAKASVPHGRHVEGVTFHGLRHTGATWALRRGTPLPDVLKLGGWRTVPQCLRYAAHTNVAAVHAAAANIRGTHPRLLKLQERRRGSR